MKVLCIALMIAAIGTIDAATVSLNHCEVAKLIIAYSGTCPIDRSDPCEDYCTGEIIETEDDCSMRDECCWTGETCAMKEIPEPRYEYSTSEENPSSVIPEHATDAPVAEHLPADNMLKRSKRRAGGGFEGNVKKDKNGITLSGGINQDVGRNGNVHAGGTYHHPSGAYDANIGYRHNIPGGHIRAGAGVSRDQWGQRDRHISIGISRRWGRK